MITTNTNNSTPSAIIVTSTALMVVYVSMEVVLAQAVSVVLMTGWDIISCHSNCCRGDLIHFVCHGIG